METKHGMPPSALYLQSIAERRDHIIGRIDKILDSYEKKPISISVWESNQLKSAIDFVADGLLDLADSELATLAEQQASNDKVDVHSISATLNAARNVNTLSLSQLRAKSRNLGQDPANNNIASE